jgi:hypothetical protein
VRTPLAPAYQFSRSCALRWNKWQPTIPIGWGAQAVTYVSSSVPTGDGREGLQPLGPAGRSALITLKAGAG